MEHPRRAQGRRRGGGAQTRGAFPTREKVGPCPRGRGARGAGQACARSPRALACRLLSSVLSGDMLPCPSGRSWPGGRSHGQLVRAAAACRDPGGQGGRRINRGQVRRRGDGRLRPASAARSLAGDACADHGPSMKGGRSRTPLSIIHKSDFRGLVVMWSLA